MIIGAKTGRNEIVPVAKISRKRLFLRVQLLCKHSTWLTRGCQEGERKSTRSESPADKKNRLLPEEESRFLNRYLRNRLVLVVVHVCARVKRFSPESFFPS